MKVTFFIATTLLVSGFMTQSAQATDWLSRIDSAVSKVESTVTRTENTINRADRTAERISNKIPETETPQKPEQPAQPTQAAAPAPQAPAKTQAQIANDTIPSAGTTTLTPEEEEILAKAKQIEEDRILREAEAIRQRQSRPEQASR